MTLNGRINRLFTEDPRLPGRSYAELAKIPTTAWTSEDWFKMRIPYCQQCMAGPWEVRPALRGTGWGLEGMEPCPHGHLVDGTRWQQQSAAAVRRDLLSAIVWGVLGFLPVLFFVGDFFAMAIAFLFNVACFVFILYRGSRNVETERQMMWRAYNLGLPYVWCINQPGNQPWLQRAAA